MFGFVKITKHVSMETRIVLGNVLFYYELIFCFRFHPLLPCLLAKMKSYENIILWLVSEETSVFQGGISRGFHVSMLTELITFKGRSKCSERRFLDQSQTSGFSC